MPSTSTYGTLADQLPEAAEDTRLVQALRAGDEGAFAGLIERLHPTMKRVARNYVASDDAADDVVQETWVAVLSGLDRFEQRSTLKTWIFRILVNRAMTQGQRDGRTTPLSSLGGTEGDLEPSVSPDRFFGDGSAQPGHWSAPPNPWHDPERRLLSLETRGRLREAIEQLPFRQRVVVTLRDVEGMSAEEVCELLDLEQANQRVLLHRGRSRLRGFLEEHLEAA